MNNFIRELMEECGLKQKDLAEIIGVSPAAVSKWNDMREISVENLYSLSKLFHITVDELLNEKRAKESLEDKWRREYNINEVAARNAMIDHDKEALLQCLETVNKTNVRFFVLLEKKIKNKITENETKELEYLTQFYEIKTQRHHVAYVQINGENINILTVNDEVKEKVGKENYEAVLWELKNKCKINTFGIDQSILSDFENDILYRKDIDGDDIYIDADIFYAWYNILTPIEKDEIINAAYDSNIGKRINILYELIKRGGNILYRPKDLNLTNYDLKDLDDFEGEIKPIPELEAAQAVIYEIYDNYSFASYEQYQSLINRDEMTRIEMEAKYKEKYPIKYWEYIKAR